MMGKFSSSGERWEAWLGGASSFSSTGPAAAAAMVATRYIRDSGYGFFVEIASSTEETPAIALGDTKDSAEKRARMISANPELFEIAQQLVSDGLSASLIRKAKEAIAKAEGGAL